MILFIYLSLFEAKCKILCKKIAFGYGFLPLDQAARNTMAIKALKAGVESWDKDLNRYIDSNLIPKYYPMEDYLRHLPKWSGKHNYVGELARRVKTDNEQMIALTYLAPEETSEDADFVSLQLIMKRLEKLFPTFTITKGTDVELGRRLTKMGYEHKRMNKGSVFKVEEI